MPVEQHRDIEVVGDHQQVFVRGQGAGDLLGGGADVDEQRAAVGDQRRGRRTDGLLLVGGDEPARLVGEVLDTRGNDGAAMNPGQRPVIAQIVKILADGLRRDLETPRQILHHHPAKGAGDIEDFRLAVSETCHDGTPGRTRPWCGRSGIRSTRQIGRNGAAIKSS